MDGRMKLNAFKLIVVFLSASLSLNSPALAASCVTSADSTALKAAVMQQLMMVAAFQCREVPAYNRFVLSHQGELQISDATLRSFFERRDGEHGEAEYNAFKTKAANLSGLQYARDASAFCLDAHALFDTAENSHDSLAAFVEERSAGMELGGVCRDARPVTVTAAAGDPREERIAGALADAHLGREAAGPSSRDLIADSPVIRSSDDEWPLHINPQRDRHGPWRSWQPGDPGYRPQARFGQIGTWSASGNNYSSH